MRQLLRFSCLIAVMLFGLGSFKAWAGVIAKSGTQIEYIDALEHDATILRLNPTNAHGISLNYFSEFKVDDAYQILNTSRTLQDGSVQPAASLIVVVSNRIDLFTDLELVGIPADLLLITTSSSGVINCQSCNIKGFKRVVMAGASPTSSLAANSLQIGNLKSSSSSTITLTSMNVSGANSVTALANNITTSGTINLHDKASKNSDGQFQSNPSGSYTMGVAELQLLVGPITWNHEKSMVQSVNVTTNSCYAKNSSTNFCYSPYNISSRTINGKIIAGAVKISAAAELNLNANIDTRSDALVFTAYAGGVMTLEEGITVQTFANGKANIKSSLYSDGVIRLRSTDDLNLLSTSTKLQGQYVELFAGDQLTNRATIESTNMTMASEGELLNEGRVRADGQLVVTSDYGISNQYGGLLSADRVSLNSKNGVVRNGSRTPYISNANERSGFIGLQGTFVDSMLSLIDGDVESENYIYSEDFTRAGTFYVLEDMMEISASRSKPADSSAHIVAGALTVFAEALENINPYYEIASGDDDIEFDPRYLYQVSILAEKSIEIAAKKYVLNSSAAIKMSNDSGLFEVDTQQLNNERYRGLSTLKFYDFYESIANYSEDVGLGVTRHVSKQADDVLITQTLASSPPGSIFSLGKFKLDASDAFLNKMGYFEIFNTAEIFSPAIHDVGFSHGGLGTITTKITDRGECNALGCPNDTATRVSDESFQVSTELDSLFYVEGDLLAQESALFFHDYSALDGFTQQVIENFLNDSIGFSSLLTTTQTRPQSIPVLTDDFKQLYYLRKDIAGTGSIVLGSGDAIYDELQEIKTSGEIAINGTEKYQEVHTTNPDGSGGDTSTKTRVEKAILSLFESLVELSEKLATSVAEFFDEIKWWDE